MAYKWGFQGTKLGVQYCVYNDAGWIRIKNRLLSWKTSEPLFSERNGYKVPLFKLGMLRVFYQTERNAHG